jgi:hypothetical protein
MTQAAARSAAFQLREEAPCRFQYSLSFISARMSPIVVQRSEYDS